MPGMEQGIGEMAEWTKAAASKAVVPARVPQVRILLSPLRTLLCKGFEWRA